jgi:ParB-like chromosome segregation protein Spo0J
MNIKYPLDLSQDIRDLQNNPTELLNSVKLQGVIKPLLVSKTGWIIIGRHRFVAACIAQNTTTPNVPYVIEK